jgi:hypothetical protein
MFECGVSKSFQAFSVSSMFRVGFDTGLIRQDSDFLNFIKKKHTSTTTVLFILSPFYDFYLLCLHVSIIDANNNHNNKIKDRK